MNTVPGLDLDVPPFDLLDGAQRRMIQDSVDMALYSANQTLIEAGRTSAHVFVIMKGSVHAYETDARGTDRRFADYGPGDVIGAWAAMAGRARHSYRADGDCLCHLIPAGLFQQLIAQNPRFAAWFNEGLAVKGQLASNQPGRREAAELMVTLVGDAQLAPAERVPGSTTIAEASALLREHKVDCLLVDDPSHDETGIVTRTDLLEALTARRLPLDAPIGALASRPLVGIGTGEVLFQALISMTERHIERVVVRDRGTIVGTLGMAEVLSHFASHSHLISLRLARARTLEDVAEASSGMTRLVRSLHAHGARIPYLMELVSALNSRVMGRIFELLVPEPHRHRICLLVMGSEGRREQLLKTDQDNGLIVADDLDWPELAEVMQRFSQALEQVGYPPCPGNVMVSNPRWRMSASQWHGQIGYWRRNFGGDAALDLSIMLDARPIAGNPALFDPIKSRLTDLRHDEILLHHLAGAALNFETPLTFFGRVRTDAQGTDLKKGGIFPIVHGLRCLALRHGIEASNSFERCEALMQQGHLSDELGRDLPQALAAFLRLRLDAQLAAIEDGRLPDNLVDTRSLRRLDRDLLRDALHVVKDFRQHLRNTFQLMD